MSQKGKQHSLVDRVRILFKTLPNIGVFRKVRNNIDYIFFLVENGFNLRVDYPYYRECLDILLENPDETRQLVQLGIRLNYRDEYEEVRRVYRDYGEEGLFLCSRQEHSELQFDVHRLYEIVEQVGYEKVKELRGSRGWLVRDMGDMLKLEKELGEENFERAVKFLQNHINDVTESNSLGENPHYRIEAVYPYMDRIGAVEESESREQSGEVHINGTVTGVGFRGTTSILYPAFGIREWHPENYGTSVIAQFTARPEVIKIFIEYLKTDFDISGYDIRLSDS